MTGSSRVAPAARAAGVLAALWGTLGFVSLLGFAIMRLGAVVHDGLTATWLPRHWAALAVSVVAMAYFEGYRAFQLAYAPRFAARAARLLHEPTALRVILAPLFCMEFFHAPSTRVLRALVLTGAIVALVLAVRGLPQPWRAIIDAGVVVGLMWGLLATVGEVTRMLRAAGSGEPGQRQ